MHIFFLVLCFMLLYDSSQSIHVINLSISFRYISQSYDYISVSEINWVDMGKMGKYQTSAEDNHACAMLNQRDVMRSDIHTKMRNHISIKHVKVTSNISLLHQALLSCEPRGKINVTQGDCHRGAIPNKVRDGSIFSNGDMSSGCCLKVSSDGFEFSIQANCISAHVSWVWIRWYSWI